MGSTLFYIVGYPGSGKTTALTNAIESRVLHTHIKPFKHVHYENGMLQIGAERAWYGGTDALPLNAQPHVLKWLSGAFDKTILAEGDRLANGKFFEAVLRLDILLRIIHIDVSELEARYRVHKRGDHFDGRWFKGRITKVDRLLNNWDKHVQTIDGRNNVHEVSSNLSQMIRNVARS